MLQTTYIRENKELILERYKKRNFDGEEIINQIIKLDDDRKSTQQTLDSQSVAYEGLKYSLVATHATEGTHVCEIVVGTDGTNSFYSQYGDVLTDSVMFSLNTSVSGGNTNLLVTPVNTNTTFYWDVSKRGE